MDEEAHEFDKGMLFVPFESGVDVCAVIQGLSEERRTLMFIPSGRLGLFVRDEDADH